MSQHPASQEVEFKRGFKGHIYRDPCNAAPQPVLHCSCVSAQHAQFGDQLHHMPLSICRSIELGLIQAGRWDSRLALPL